MLHQCVVAGLGACARQDPILAVDRGLRRHLFDILGQETFAVAEDIGGECDVAKFRPHLRELLRLLRHALAGVDHQHGGPLAVLGVVIDGVALETLAAMGVVEPFLLELGLRLA